MKEKIFKRLNEIKNLILKQNSVKKEILDAIEASEYLNISASCLYKMTSNSTIPFYKPNGKKIYFKRTELDEWILNNK